MKLTVVRLYRKKQRYKFSHQPKKKVFAHFVVFKDLYGHKQTARISKEQYKDLKHGRRTAAQDPP